ncbi:iron donor protein CyaY [Candidatus Symbiobacter mobilis]|uniref:Iron-sulfur cluster assembly protein CyaY n=1 Tax=Candidatus Symbiobacter mobilis CR TaxID=946483 RepID=U5NE97_9BURK|nr:iron donor protein CyaY [Candidatus Symbiobacter mobilis]AGX88464.1 CyaY protein [Candidatus Symbiobacter mobilis CR]
MVDNDREFWDRAQRVLAAVEEGCDTQSIDIDCCRSGDMLTLTPERGGQIVVNLQKPLQEIWLAAGEGGYHFRFDGQRWLDTRGRGGFFDILSRIASDSAGCVLSFEER